MRGMRAGMRARSLRSHARALATLACYHAERTPARSLRSRAAMRDEVLAKCVRRGARSVPPSGSPLLPCGMKSWRSPNRPPRRWRGASCRRRAGETPALCWQGYRKTYVAREITSPNPSLAPLARCSMRNDRQSRPCGTIALAFRAVSSRTSLACVIKFLCWSPCGSCGRRSSRGPPPRCGCWLKPAPAPCVNAVRRASCALAGARPLRGAGRGCRPAPLAELGADICPPPSGVSRL